MRNSVHVYDERSSDGGENAEKETERGGMKGEKERERETVDVRSAIRVEFRKPRAGHFPREKLLPGAASQRSRILFVRGCSRLGLALG